MNAARSCELKLRTRNINGGSKSMTIPQRITDKLATELSDQFVVIIQFYFYNYIYIAIYLIFVVDIYRQKV